MSMFVEVFSFDKNCNVIINLDTVLEIAPLKEGGCNIFFPDSAAVGGKTSMKVRENYTMFKQFVLETVSQEMIAERIQRMNMIEKEPYPRVIPQAQPDPIVDLNKADAEREARREADRARRAARRAAAGTTTADIETE